MNVESQKSLNQNITSLSEQVDEIENSIFEIKFKLEKAHCDLVLTMDPTINLNAEEGRVECEKCTSS